MAGVWRMRATARTRDVSPELQEGLNAYAMEHVLREERTCIKLSREWSGLRAKAAEYLAEQADVPGEPGSDVGDIFIDMDNDDNSDVEGDELVNGEGEGEDDFDEDEF